ncbi:uncharacterized protein [Atheta coriaria]|uniref:uncharacterized protein n=1 Tax=Dalotia coriaria TaxID=877792 RepID=UPI0031F3B9F6
MKSVVVLISALLSVGSVPVPQHFVPGTRSTYHGILGTFDVSPVPQIAHVYSPFAQTIGYSGYSGYPYQFHVASPVVNYYTPSVSFVGGHQFAGVPFLDAVNVPAPIAPVTPVESVPNVPDSIATESHPPTQVPTDIPTENPQDTIENIQNDSVNLSDDDDTVTIESA